MDAKGRGSLKCTSDGNSLDSNLFINIPSSEIVNPQAVLRVINKFQIYSLGVERIFLKFVRIFMSLRLISFFISRDITFHLILSAAILSIGSATFKFRPRDKKLKFEWKILFELIFLILMAGNSI